MKNQLLSVSPVCDLYSQFTLFLLDNLFGSAHTIVVATTFVTKKILNVHIMTGKEWFAKVIGKNGQTINAIEGLLKVKGYLNGYQITVKIDQ